MRTRRKGGSRCFKYVWHCVIHGRASSLISVHCDLRALSPNVWENVILLHLCVQKKLWPLLNWKPESLCAHQSQHRWCSVDCWNSPSIEIAWLGKWEIKQQSAWVKVLEQDGFLLNRFPARNCSCCWNCKSVINCDNNKSKNLLPDLLQGSLFACAFAH
jgi:hypothetical protein